MTDVHDTSGAVITAALAQVGSRLRGLRTQRRITLTDLEATTGISKSTLSWLETGQRGPTLEPLLACRTPTGCRWTTSSRRPRWAAHASGSSPAASGDGGVIPLTRQPDGIQAWRIVVPTREVTPGPRAHDGPAEILGIVGRPAERVDLRTTPPQRERTVVTLAGSGRDRP
jgi:transcriptional regulator with XRE-family HTH domain